MNEKLVLFILTLHLCNGAAIERDLLLTPNENLQILGRTLYYNPSSYEINGTVPWEETLKHVTFLTLFGKTGNNTNLSDLQEYKDFMGAPYIKVREEYPRFGDIITMAQGWVQKANTYSFKEGICEDICLNNALAVWRVQKIRHRDSERGFRYEMKFSVTPLDNKALLQNTHQHMKSFILKDDEYPMSFNALTRRSDSFESFSNERQARIVNHGSREDFTYMPHLNIGEFIKQVPKASSKVGYVSTPRDETPTTYRPNYRVRFAKPEVYEAPKEPKTVVTHHFHHHYFMNDVEPSSIHDRQLYHANPDAIRIIEPPHVENLAPQPVLTTTTTEAPSAKAVFYMQQLPLYIQSFPREETSTRPFRQSEQHFEEIRYSDPDPLYENVDAPRNDEQSNNYRNAADSASGESHSQVERPSSQALNSVIEPIPQSAEDQSTHIPYVVEVKQERSTTPKPTTLSSTRRTLISKNKFFVTMPTITSSENSIPISTRLTPKSRHYIQRATTTTEKPISKWKPKRKPKEKEVSKNDLVTTQSSTDEKVITVTPSKADLEVLTKKSVSKSISIRVGNRSEEFPLITETATASTIVSSESSDQDYNENES